MLPCLLFWGGKIPDTTPTLPAKLLFKLIEKCVLKQSDNQYPTAVLIAEHQSILSFRQDDHMGKATYYGRFTTRVEVARQAGVCYYTPCPFE
jgi:hypothetical protein